MTRRLARLNCFVVLALAILVLTLEGLALLDGGNPSTLGITLLLAPCVIVFSALAFLIVVRRPENVIGPGFSLIVLIISVTGLADSYVSYGLDVSERTLPAIETAAWLTEWTWVPALMPLLTFLFLLCPDGRLLSSRWRPWAYAMAANLTLLALGVMFSPFESRTDLENPYLIAALGKLPEYATSIGYIGLIPSFGLSALAIVLRFRRSSGIERQQLKWFTSASLTVVGCFPVVWIASSQLNTESLWGIWLAGSLAFVLFATAIAILRYRLYELDRIINRTLVYAALTAVLGALYFGLVVGLQELLAPLSGGSDLAIALTTLAVAALFLPARDRIQRLVDRRFNRRRYDAAQTIEVFSARLREEIDLDTLRAELLGVLDETMQPSGASIWLRAPGVTP